MCPKGPADYYYDGKRFHFSETLGVPLAELGSHGDGGSGGKGVNRAQCRGRRIIIKSFKKKLLKLNTFFSGPRLAKFIAFFWLFFGSLLPRRCFPHLGASFGRF